MFRYICVFVLLLSSTGILVYVFTNNHLQETLLETNPCPSPAIKTCESENENNISTYVDFGHCLTPEQYKRVTKCINTHTEESAKGLKMTRRQSHIRYEIHRHQLNRFSFVVELGGHRGLDTSALNSWYHPKTYIVLEPVPMFYEILSEKFDEYPNIRIYNYGVDSKNATLTIDLWKDGTSLYKNREGAEKVKIKIIDVHTFFKRLKVPPRRVDLLTMNCEGCEYAVLDYILSTEQTRYFRNIQFQPHISEGLCNPLKRYCLYQEILAKTHNLTYQHKFYWESWTLKTKLQRKSGNKPYV